MREKSSLQPLFYLSLSVLLKSVTTFSGNICKSLNLQGFSVV